VLGAAHGRPWLGVVVAPLVLSLNLFIFLAKLRGSVRAFLRYPDEFKK
jgi:hypothetical protein